MKHYPWLDFFFLNPKSFINQTKKHFLLSKIIQDFFVTTQVFFFTYYIYIYFFFFEKLSHIILVKNIWKNSIEYMLKTQLLNNLATEIGARKLILSKVKIEKLHNSGRTSVAECTIPIFSFSFYFRFYILCVYYFSSTCNYLIKCYNNLVWVKLY